MSEEEIINLHREVFEYLMEKRKENPELYFTLNKNKPELELGYYFNTKTNDNLKNVLKFSFWVSYKIRFFEFVIEKNALTLGFICTDTDLHKDLQSVIDDFERVNDNISANEYGNWKVGLDFFLENDKAIIDNFFKENKLNYLIEPKQFNRWLKQVEHFAPKRRKHKPSSDFKLNPKIRLSLLTLKNIGHFSDISLDLSKNVTILIGENGSGKSTLLRSIAFAITGLNAFDLDKDYSKEKNKLINHLLKIENYEEAVPIYAEKGEIRLLLSPDINLNLVFAPSSLVSSKVEAEEIDASERTKILHKSKFLKQTVIGFSQGEKIIGINLETKQNSEPLVTDLFPLISNTTTDFLASLEEWIYYFIHEKNDFATVEQLFSIISKIVNDSEGYAVKLKQPYKTAGVIGSPNGEKSIIVCTPDAPNGIQLGLVSQGYQNIFRFIAGIIIKLNAVKDNFYFFDEIKLNQIPAIVLIDEIDTYLHPNWQANILKVLVEEFPNVQFVVTTHSDEVLRNWESTENIKFSDIQNYQIKDGKVTVPSSSPIGRDATSVKNIMGVQNKNEQAIRRIGNQILEAIQKHDLGAIEEHKRELSRYTTEDHPIWIRINSLLDRLKAE